MLILTAIRVFLFCPQVGIFTGAHCNSPKMCCLLSTVLVSAQNSLAPVPSPKSPQAPWRRHSDDTCPDISPRRDVSLRAKLWRNQEVWRKLKMLWLKRNSCFLRVAKMTWSLLSVHFTGGPVVGNPRQYPGAFFQVGCKNCEDTLLGLLLSPENLGKPRGTISLGVEV